MNDLESIVCIVEYCGIYIGANFIHQTATAEYLNDLDNSDSQIYNNNKNYWTEGWIQRGIHFFQQKVPFRDDLQQNGVVLHTATKLPNKKKLHRVN